MKKFIFSLAILLTGYFTQAQSDQYKQSMSTIIARLDASKGNPDAYVELGNGFKRIADAENGVWMPRYYQAYCLIMQSMFVKKDQVDGLLDQADEILGDVSAKVKNDEVMCLQALSQSTRISVDPASRGMKYGPASQKFLDIAQQVNPENPRVYFLKGQNAFYTPEQFGGGKKKAEAFYQKAIEKFEKQKPATDFSPRWGEQIARQMLAQCAEPTK